MDLTFVNGSEPQTLDPALISGQIEGRLCAALLEGLLTRDAAGQLIEGCAKRWECSGDGLTWTFHLRDNARWSNGDPVTSSDFVYAWRRALDASTGSPYAEILFPIKNAEAYHKGRIKDFSQVGIRTLNDHTLVVTLEQPTLYFLDLVAFTTYFPVHRPTIEKHGVRWTRPENFVGNGAFVLESWKILDSIDLRKSSTYWRAEKTMLNRIRALAISDASTAFNVYSTGMADLLLDKGLIPPMLIEELRGRRDFHGFDFMGTYFYRFNVTRPPLDKPLVRKALSAAIDRQGIVEKITRAGESPAGSLTPPGVGGYRAPQGIQHYPAQAKEWLEQAGFPGGKGFPRLTILYNKTELNEQIAVEIQAQWKNHLGIEVELKNQHWGPYLESLDQLDYDIARSSWVGDYNDPNTFLDCFVTGRGNNRTGWSHRKYDDLLARTWLQTDAVTRHDMLAQAESILVQSEAVIAPIYFYRGILMFDPDRIGGVQGNILDEHPFREMYLKP